MLAWLLLLTLTALAAFAALGVTLRVEPEGRAETGVVLTLVFYALVCAPVMLLGYGNQLRPAPLAVLSLLTSAGALLASARRRPLADHLRDITRAAAGLARLPGDASRLAFRARSFALLGLACAAFAIVASAVLTVLAPSESWDGFFYHEPMVGFALQNHGFRVVDLPQTMVVQCTNGYPRLCEAFALWFVIFTDKTLIEIGNTVAAPGLMLAAFLIARRYCADPVPLLGWSAAVLLMPATVTQLRSSMIDVEVGFFILAAVHYATRPVLRREDAFVATLCLVLLAGAKSTALTWAPPLALVTYGRLLFTQRSYRRGPALLLASGGAALMAAVGALTFVRNWVVFHNPLWPVAYEIPRLHVRWPGLSTLADLTHDRPFLEMVRMKYQHPTEGIGDVIARDYGYGVPWVVVPLAAAALIAAVVVATRARLSRRPDALTENLLLVAALGAVFVVVSPTLTIARFNTHIVVIAMVAIAWAAGRMRDGDRFHEGAIAATLLLTIVPMIWTGWFFGVDVHTLGTMLRRSAAERATMHFADFQMPPDVARARERELGDGDLLVFTQEMFFPGVLWNQRMTNRVAYVEFKSAPAFLDEIERQHAKWVVVGAHGGARNALAARPAAWEYVGQACRQDQTVAFRRR